MPLINYVKTVMNKRLLISESDINLNRCTPYRGNLINMLHASHAQPTYGPGPYVSHAVNT
jgi:hypothetical protein